jgi:hypothetical protein
MATIENTTFTWFFQNFVAYPTLDNFKDVIFMINWKYNASYVDPISEEIYKCETSRMTQVSTNDITDFVPYDQLTQQMVIDWISAEENVSVMQQEMIDDINKQINPPAPTIVVLPPPFPQ